MFVRNFALALIFGSIAWNAHAQTQTRTTAFEYELATGLLSKEVIEPGDPNLCVATTYLYDNFGNRTDATTRNCGGLSNEAAAPAAGSPALITSRANQTSYAPTADNPVAGQFATSSSNALTQTEKRSFDPRFGRITKLAGPNTAIPPTTWTYDAFGRKKQETRADTTTTTWSYNFCAPAVCPAGAVYYATVASTGAPTSSVYYDKLNREVRSETQGFDGTSTIRKDTVYDQRGRVWQVSKPYQSGQTPIYWTKFFYDDMNRVVTTTEPATDAGQLTTTNTYNGLSVSVSVNTTPVQTKTTVKNAQGQVGTVTDAQGNTVTYAYDVFGNLVQTNAGGVLTTLGYDLRGRKISMNDPDMGAWSYAYDVLGEVVRQTDAKGQLTTTVYDVLGRVTSRSEADLVSTWTYDNCSMGIGKLCAESAGNYFSRSVGYDPLGRPISLSVSIDVAYSVTTTYVTSGPNIGKVDTVTYPTGFGVKNVYHPNNLGYLYQVKVANPAGNPAFALDGTLLWQANSLSPLARSDTLGNSLVQASAFDALGRPTGINAGVIPGAIFSQSYSYDLVGNLAQRIDNVQGVTENFSYDNLNRVTMASGTNNAVTPPMPLVTRAFYYDPTGLGNITNKSDVGAYAYPAVGAARPHAVASVTSASGAVSLYSYDANGNLISGGGRTLTYTSFNMPLRIQAPAATYTYTYSPEHERVRLDTQLTTGTQTSIYLHPGAGTLFYEKEIKPDGTLEHKHYVQAGSGLLGVYVTKSSYSAGDGPGMRYYHRDHLGSIIAISNEAGARIETLGYEAFGKRRSPDGTADPDNRIFGNFTDRGFTAHEHLDELGLIHMNGRVYDPLLGRFMTPDGVIQAPGNLQSYNRYAYVWNNPLNSTDPSGFSRWTRFRDKAEHVAVGVAALGLGGAATLAAGQAIVDHKDDIARFTTKALGELGRVKYVGGMLTLVALTDPQFGIAYGWSTGDWKTVARAEATAAVMVATYWAGGAGWTAFGNLGLAGGAAYVSVSASIGAVSTYAISRINGGSNSEALHAGLRGGERAALMAGMRFGFEYMKGVTDSRALAAAATREAASGGDISYIPRDASGDIWTYGVRGCESDCSSLLSDFRMPDETWSLNTGPFAGCTICQTVGNAISKVHDFMSDFSYSNATGLTNVQGYWSNTALDFWSFGTMPVAAVYVAQAFGGMALYQSSVFARPQ
jgi:RHS repeat-associated protein